MIPLETSKQYFVLVCWLLSLTTISIGQSKCISNITDQDDSTLLMFKYYKTNEEDKNKVTIQIDGITYTKKKQSYCTDRMRVSCYLSCVCITQNENLH